VEKCGEYTKSESNEKSMFIGEYAHAIDSKNRLAVPSKFRADLGDKIIITRGLDTCLFVYPLAVWEGLAKKLSAFPVGDFGARSFVRLMLAGASDVTVDKQGRVLIPEYLCTYAEVEKNVIIAGLFDRLEIWNESRWNKYTKKAEKNTDDIAQKLGELGLY